MSFDEIFDLTAGVYIYFIVQTAAVVVHSFFLYRFCFLPAQLVRGFTLTTNFWTKAVVTVAFIFPPRYPRALTLSRTGFSIPTFSAFSCSSIFVENFANARAFCYYNWSFYTQESLDPYEHEYALGRIRTRITFITCIHIRYYILYC